MRTHLLIVLAAMFSATPLALAQEAGDTLSYELVSASMSRSPGRDGFVLIEFGRSLPKRYLAAANSTVPAGNEWAIESRSLDTPAVVDTVAVRSVFVPDRPGQRRIVALEPASPLDPATHQIRVRLLEANFPEVTIGQPRKPAAAAFYGPAKGKDDADVYFKGLAVGTSQSKPAYSIDAKLAYLRPLRAGRGSLGGGATYTVDKASDIGPDSITVTTTYSKVLAWAAATGLVLDVDPIGVELDAGNDTRNLRSAARGQLVVPSARIGANSFVTGDVLLGYEAGRVQKGAADGSSPGIWRTVVGAGGYALLRGGPVVKRIDISAAWTVRLLAQPEPITRLENGVASTRFTDEPRHLVTVAGVLMVTRALGLSIGYRHGSEPPTYKAVKHRGEIGVVLKLKQIDKG